MARPVKLMILILLLAGVVAIGIFRDGKTASRKEGLSEEQADSKNTRGVAAGQAGAGL